MKLRSPVLCFSFVCFVLLLSCTKPKPPFEPSYAGDWTPVASLKGISRSEAVSFSINNIAYIGTGLDAQNVPTKDFWKYDVLKDTWTQIASMPAGTARSSAVAFSVNGKGYVGTGFDGTQNLNDFYEYDPASDSWSKKNSLSGIARRDAIAFSIGNKGYIGTGFDGANALNDFYQYDPATDSWTDVGYPGSARYGAVCWAYNNKGYVVTGTNNFMFPSDFWVFDPAYEPAKWQRLEDIVDTKNAVFDDVYVGITRANGVAFTIGDDAYVTTGDNGGKTKVTWQYNMSTDLWTVREPFEGPITTGALGFSLKSVDTSYGYILIPDNTVHPGSDVSPNFWRFTPWLAANPTNN